MRTFSLISAIIVLSVTVNKGKNCAHGYMCEELQAIGVNNFRFIIMTAYTQKFPNGTFEEVSSVVNDITELAEECCRNDTDPTCFSKRESAISQRPCEKVSLLHWHPDMKQCCSLHVNERTRCLLRLQYSEEQLPSLLELSNEEICAEYKQDPNSFTLRYVYEFARRHRSVPAGFMLNVTLDHARMAKNCCSPKVSTPCFLQEFTSFLKVLCKESILSSMPNEFKMCCGKGLLDSLTCMDNLKRQPLASGNTTEITGTQLCENHQPDSLDRYLFQIGVKHTSVSLPVLTTIQNHLRNTVEACCSEANDTKACLEEKENSLEKKAALLTKADGFCSQYFKLDLPAFKTMVEREVQGEGAEARAQAWVELVTSCCFQHSPAQLCQNLTEAIVKSEDGSTA